MCSDQPVAINTLRARAKSEEEFDKQLESYINLYTMQPEIDYPDGKNSGYALRCYKPYEYLQSIIF